MEELYFKKQIEENINDLDTNQVVFFAWLCAVRSLPFIGISGNFNLWKESDKLKHLYAVINVIDNIAVNRSADNVISANNNVNAPLVAADIASAAALFTGNITASVADAAAYAYTYAALAVTGAIAHADSMMYKYANIAALATDAAANKKWHHIILKDISDIKSDKYNELNNNTDDLYGVVWKNFQEMLKNLGCAYWGELYEKIFKDRFQLDKEKLEKRLKVPSEIKNKGAKAVADYFNVK